jgi:hypothetical protein
MAVGGESLAGLNAVFIDDPQAAKPHEFWIHVFGEGEGVPGVQPAVVFVPPFLAAANLNHDAPRRSEIQHLLVDITPAPIFARLK